MEELLQFKYLKLFPQNEYILLFLQKSIYIIYFEYHYLPESGFHRTHQLSSPSTNHNKKQAQTYASR